MPDIGSAIAELNGEKQRHADAIVDAVRRHDWAACDAAVELYRKADQELFQLRRVYLAELRYALAQGKLDEQPGCKAAVHPHPCAAAH